MIETVLLFFFTFLPQCDERNIEVLTSELNCVYQCVGGNIVFPCVTGPYDDMETEVLRWP